MTSTGREAQIRDTVSRYEKAQNDLLEFTALHTADTAVVNIAGRRVLGLDHLTEAMQSALASPLAQVNTTLEIQDIRFIRPDVALVSAVKHVHDNREQADTAFPSTGSLTLLLTEQDDVWKVSLAQTTPRLGS